MATKPGVPEILTVESTSDKSLRLRWKDNTLNEYAFRIERRQGSGSWIALASASADVEERLDTGLLPETTYEYRVKAFNTLGSTSWSPYRKGKTLPTPLPEPEPDATVVIFGAQSGEYDKRNFPPDTVIDAMNASWLGAWRKAVQIGGFAGLRWRGGRIETTFDEAMSWSDWHDAYALTVWDTPNPVIERLVALRNGDGIKLMNPLTTGAVIRSCYFKDMHDDAIEGDWLPEVLIEDCCIDRAYMAFGMRQRSGDEISDGRQRHWTIKDSLVWVGPQQSVYSGSSPGNASFFKFDRSTGKSPRVNLKNVIFRLDQKPGVNTPGAWVEPDKLDLCENVTVVWLGEGDYPVPLPANVTLTRDKSVWDTACAAWKAAHAIG